MNEISGRPSQDIPDISPRAERVIQFAAVLVLLLCTSCPWAMWIFWGPWAGLGGVLISHVLYLLLLAPKSGICLGIPWIYVFVNGIIAMLAIGAALL